MSSPVPPPVTTGSTPPPAGRPGCARLAFIGCGVLALLLLAAVVGVFLYLRRNPAVLTDLMMNQIENHFGPDVTETDKRDLRAAYQDFRTAVNQHRVDQNAMRGMQFTFSGTRSSTVDHEQVRALIRSFREAAGRPVPAGEPTPHAPPPHPTP